MKKIVLALLIIASSAIVSGCGFSNCCYNTCSSCGSYSANCCGSNGWY